MIKLDHNTKPHYYYPKLRYDNPKTTTLYLQHTFIKIHGKLKTN